MLKDRLRQARKEADKTQKEVAEHIGVTESTYCCYESGKRQPDALKIRKIASFLGISGDFLLEIDTKPEEETPATPYPQVIDEAQELISIYNSLNRKGKEHLLLTARSLAGNPETQEGPTKQTAT